MQHKGIQQQGKWHDKSSFFLSDLDVDRPLLIQYLYTLLVKMVNENESVSSSQDQNPERPEQLTTSVFTCQWLCNLMGEIDAGLFYYHRSFPFLSSNTTMPKYFSVPLAMGRA